MLSQELSSMFGFAFIVGLGLLSNYFLHRIEIKPLKIQNEERNSGRFIAERAYTNLKTLNNFGPKVVGSAANEIKAFDFIFDKLNSIRNSSEKLSDITIDHQVVSGLVAQSAVYVNLQNIVVRIQGQTDHALLLNCHFDSVPGSPGASDDSVMCCVMIELVRVLSKAKATMKHSVIFLFNGSEEEDLQAAHGFITQHRWAKDVRAYINLESTGSGGREILFRSGPKHDWLIKMYQQSVPHPFGQAVAEELFETGFIPSATDFEIFRDYGKIPGLDFAYVEDGWRYHTRYDSVEYISMESIQHTGDNILKLTKKIANSIELAKPREGSSTVYLDYLGLFFISYTKTVGIVLNITISLFAVFVPLIIESKLQLAELLLITVETLISWLTVILSTVLSASSCYLLAVVMNAFDNTMSWFNTIFLSIGIYGSLALLVQIGTYHVIQLLSEKFIKFNRTIRNQKENLSAEKSRRLRVELIGVNLFWACLTITVTVLGYRSGYVIMILLFFSLCTNIVVALCCYFLPTLRSHSWVFLHFLGHTFVFLWLSYCMNQVWELFIPIAAKQYYANPDVLIALICTLWSVLCLSYFVPLTTLIRHRAVLYSILLVSFSVSMILAFTSVGFPYSDSKQDPRLQRFRFIHTRRTFYDQEGNKTFSENGFLLSAIDRNAVRTLESSFDPRDMINWRDDLKCREATYCGFPLYRFDRGNYLKGDFDKPTVKATKFTVIQAVRDPNNSTNLVVEFKIKLKTLTMIYITPGDGWTFVQGSLPTSQRTWNGKTFRYSKITYGKSTKECTRETITLKESAGLQSNKLDVVTFTIVTIESVFSKSPNYTQLMKTFPEWAFVMEQQADVSSYIIKEEI